MTARKKTLLEIAHSVPSKRTPPFNTHAVELEEVAIEWLYDRLSFTQVKKALAAAGRHPSGGNLYHTLALALRHARRQGHISVRKIQRRA